MDKKRLKALLSFFILIALILLARLFYLQVVRYSFFENKAKKQRMRIIKKAADRGDILDRNGQVLATSVDSYSVFINPSIFNDREKLSQVLGRPVPEASRRRVFYWVKRKASKELANQVEKLNLKGVGILTEKKRVYPKGHLASQILGFVGLDNEGLSGVELTYDEDLKGQEGLIYTESDARGIELLSARQESHKQSVPGANLTLTIDENIQFFAERELEKIMKAYHGKSSLAVVMEIETGELLALAGKPDFDPNQYSKFPPRIWQNKFVQLYEPGSTFKVITLASGLDEKVIDLDTKLRALDQIEVGGKIIKNSHQIKWPGSTISPSYMLEQSANTGAVQIGLLLGKERFYKKMKDFGFGAKIGIGLPGESAGILRPPQEWYKPDIAMMSFGQSIAVTPLQLIAALASIANDGKRMKPILVKKIESLDYESVKAQGAEQMNRTLSEDAAKKVRECMENVVLKGSGRKSKIPGYRVAGKTGTAQKIAEGYKGYLEGRFIASYIGYTPASRPKLIAMVMVDEPQGCIWGETVAGPAVGEILKQTLRYLNIEPDLLRE